MGALGTDTGGSIRNPASFCGIAGLMPTYGRVSRKGVIPYSFSLDHCGPMAWTAEDCAVMLQAIAGYDPDDPGSANVPVPDYTAALNEGISGMRIGVIRHFYEPHLPPEDEMWRAFEAALLEHPAVRECAVVGVPDRDRGQIVKAYVVLNERYVGSPELVQTLQQFVKQTIAPYKYPRAVEFRASLPKTATGKLQRHALRNGS